MTEISNKKYKALKRFEIKSNPSEFESTKVTCSKDCFNVVYKFFENDIDIYESFFVLLLNRSNTTIGFAKISQGGICGTVVDARIIAKYAIETLASSVILCHNHPSGNLIPSNEDKAITKKLKEALALFNIDVTDHIILCPERKYYSFADEGVL